MQFDDHIIFKIFRFSIGRVKDTKVAYLSFPVSNGLGEYEEYYRLSDVEYENALSTPAYAKILAEELKLQKDDARMLIKPGELRGRPN